MIDVREVEQNIELASSLLKALSNERRLQIICALYKGEKCVSDLEKIVGLRQSALSQHLALLREGGLVETRRQKQVIWYSLSNMATTKLLRALYDIYRPEEQVGGDGKLMINS